MVGLLIDVHGIFSVQFCRFSPSFLIFILSSIPSLWILEMRRVALRRLTTASNTNGTTSEFLDRFVARMGNDDFDPTQALPYQTLVKTVKREENLLLTDDCSFV